MREKASPNNYKKNTRAHIHAERGKTTETQSVLHGGNAGSGPQFRLLYEFI